MPVGRCQQDGRPGWRCGDAGKCYTYPEGDAAAEKAAKQDAIDQCVAMGEEPAADADPFMDALVDAMTSPAAGGPSAEMVDAFVVPRLVSSGGSAPPSVDYTDGGHLAEAIREACARMRAQGGRPLFTVPVRAAAAPETPTDEINRLVRLGHRRAAQLEARLAGLLEPILNSHADEAAGRFLALTEAQGQAGPPAAPEAATGEPGASERPILAAAGWQQPYADELVDVDELVKELRTKTDPVRLAAVEAMMGPVLEGSGITFDPRNPHARRVLEQSGSQVTHVAETTRENVRRIVTKAYEEGLTIPDTAKAIRQGMRAATPARATLIARTELVGAVNGGSLAAVQIVDEHTGLRHVKVWLTAGGARYPRHELYPDLDGQTVGLDEAFVVGDADLLYPGDPDGPPEEVCNCRCAVAYEEEAASADGQAAAGDEEPPEAAPSPAPAPATGVPGIDKPAAGRLELKVAVEGRTTAGGKKLTERQALSRMQKVVDDFAKFYGIEKRAVRYEPEATAAWETDARTLITPSGEHEIWVGAGPVERAMDAEMGVFPFRQIAHEAAHTIQREGMPAGRLHDLEEGGAEILSLRYWADRGQPFDFRDAVRVEGRWTDPGVDSLAHSVVYRDQVVSTMRRAASRVGWDRDKVTAETLRMMRGDHGERLTWLDATDPEYALPAGVDDAPGLIRWLAEPAPAPRSALEDRGFAWGPTERRFSVEPPDPPRWREWMDSLTPEQRDAVWEYTSRGGYKGLNRALREGRALTAEQAELDRDLRAAVDAAPQFDGEVTAWRGVDLGAQPLGPEGAGLTRAEREALQFERLADFAEQQYRPGETVKLGGWQSASTYTDPALDAALSRDAPGVVFEIRTREGALLKPPLTRYDDEAEILLGPDTEYVVERVLRDVEFERGDYGDTVRRTVVQVRALPREQPPLELSPAVSLGTRPWIHLKDSTLDSHIRHARLDRDRALKAGDHAAAVEHQLRFQALQLEKDIRLGRRAEDRPWSHLKDTTLKSHIRHVRLDITRAASKEEAESLRVKLATLERELEIRTGQKPAGEGGGKPARQPGARQQRKAATAQREAAADEFNPAKPSNPDELMMAAAAGRLREGVLYRAAAGYRDVTRVGTYTSKSGWVTALRAGDRHVPVFIEDNPHIHGDALHERFRAAMADIYRAAPQMEAAIEKSALSRIELFKGRSPWDKEFSRRAGGSFEAAGTYNSGSGRLAVYRSGIDELGQGGPSVLQHELGHAVGRQSGPPDVDAWVGATLDDQATSAKLAGTGNWETSRGPWTYDGDFRVKAGETQGVHRWQAGRESVTPYGGTNLKEDWAESIMLYLLDKTKPAAYPLDLGTIRDPATNFLRPATFAEVWPERARLIEEWLAARAAPGAARLGIYD